ncbi:MAG: hypothetical protein Q9219_003916 [cf. Caloplaca sp. 3 TL-2023]
MPADTPPLDQAGFNLYASQQGRIIATSAALIALTTTFVSLRLLSRRLSRAGLWWDDAFAVIALFRRILYIFAGVITCCAVAVVIVSVFQCTPVHAFWDVDTPGHCINIDHFFLASGSINVLFDFIIFVLPIPLLWRLRTSFSQKVVLTAIFTLAGFVVVVSIIRVAVLSRIGKRDLTWNYVNAGIWAETEPAVAVICACLPSLRPLCPIVSRALGIDPICKLSISNPNSDSNKWLKVQAPNDNDDFNRLDYLDDLGRIYGHNVAVHGGREGKVVLDMEGVPKRGIKVETEVVLVSSERLDYRDRLF